MIDLDEEVPPPARPKTGEDAEDDRHGEEGYGTYLVLLMDAAFRPSSSSSPPPPLERKLTLLLRAPPPLPLRAHRFGPSRNRRNATASSRGVRHGPVAPSASRAMDFTYCSAPRSCCWCGMVAEARDGRREERLPPLQRLLLRHPRARQVRVQEGAA